MFPFFGNDDDEAVTPRRLGNVSDDEQKNPAAELPQGAADVSAADHCLIRASWEKKVKEVAESAGVNCPDLADGAVWSFDALGAIWGSDGWLLNVVLPALRGRDSVLSDSQVPYFQEFYLAWQGSFSLFSLVRFP